MRSNMTDPELREILLTIRQLELKNILLYTSELPEYKLLNLVSMCLSILYKVIDRQSGRFLIYPFFKRVV